MKLYGKEKKMTREEKQLLMADLCARLPYGVIAQVDGWDEEEEIDVIVPLRVYSINTDGYACFGVNDYNVDYCMIEDCTPYLRPMSSMTEEERRIFTTLLAHALPFTTVEWLDKKHFDHRTNEDGDHLINIGLALEAPEDMYMEEQQ